MCKDASHFIILWKPLSFGTAPPTKGLSWSSLSQYRVGRFALLIHWYLSLSFSDQIASANLRIRWCRLHGHNEFLRFHILLHKLWSVLTAHHDRYFGRLPIIIVDLLWFWSLDLNELPLDLPLLRVSDIAVVFLLPLDLPLLDVSDISVVFVVVVHDFPFLTLSYIAVVLVVVIDNDPLALFANVLVQLVVVAHEPLFCIPAHVTQFQFLLSVHSLFRVALLVSSVHRHAIEVPLGLQLLLSDNLVMAIRSSVLVLIVLSLESSSGRRISQI